MTDDFAEAASLDLIDERTGRWLHVAAWVIALVVFELTADPALVVLVGCSKFGWVQLRAARWLRKNDPDRSRGRACRWFYLSWGLWRISIVATLLLIAVVLILEQFRVALGAAPKPMAKLPSQMRVGLLVAWFGFMFAVIITIVGLISAWRGRVRVWVGNEAIEAFRRRQWPPVGPATSWNRVGPMILVSITLAFFFGVITLTCVGMGIVLVASFVGAGKVVMGIVGVAALVALIRFSGTIPRLVDASKPRTQASSPADCWPNQEGTPPSSSHITFGNAFR